ncbi:MAG TPA: DNA adenine methylase [Candidatus Paceibacterota bacterium]|nr:DNA adenine methylase [Candidatus Paceibacterota bacterium]
MAKALFRYVGAKNKIIKTILQFVPEHKNYAEVFGGSAALLLNKKPANDIYNDINSDVVNIFRILRDEEKSKKLKFLLENTPVSREEFNTFREKIKIETDEFQRAYMYFYLLKFTFGGKTDTFSFPASKVGQKINKEVNTYLNTLKFFDFYTERLRQVLVENLHFKKFFNTYISHWDYNNSFVYLDPPYLKCSEKSSKLYSTEMKLEDHEELIKLVLKYENNAKFLISGFESDLYKDLLEKQGWKKFSFIRKCDLKRETQTRQLRQECLWFNYDIKEVAK